jgi:hypothetical protein
MNLKCNGNLQGCVSVGVSSDSEETGMDDPFKVFPVIQTTESREGLFVQPSEAVLGTKTNSGLWPENDADLFRDSTDKQIHATDNLVNAASLSFDSLDTSALSGDSGIKKRVGMPNVTSFGSDGLGKSGFSRRRSHIHLLESSDDEEGANKTKGRTLFEV